MAQWTIRRECGHTVTQQLYGPGAERERKATWLKSQPCRDCQSAVCQAEAIVSSAVAGLAPLAGTPKQVAWAETIRARILAEANAIRREWVARGAADGPLDTLTDLTDRVMGHVDACYWIDRRDLSATLVIREAKAAR